MIGSDNITNVQRIQRLIVLTEENISGFRNTYVELEKQIEEPNNFLAMVSLSETIGYLTQTLGNLKTILKKMGENEKKV